MNYDRLKNLKNLLKKSGADGFILPVTDEYQGEYSAPYARRVTWLSGFDGSAGALVVLRGKAALFVDGRYTLQAASEVDNHDYEIYNIADKTPANYVAEQLQAGDKLLYDPWLHTKSGLDRIEKILSDKNIIAEPIGVNLIDKIWAGQPSRPTENIVIHSEKYAGISAKQKCDELAEKLKSQSIDVALITMPDSICWLLNIRGADIPYNPLPLCYGLLRCDAKATLFVQNEASITSEVKEKLSSFVEFKTQEMMADELQKLSGKKVAYDPARSPVWFHDYLRYVKADLSLQDDICILPKSIKNQTEQDGMKQAHIIDGLAVTKFLHWFDTLPSDAIVDELGVVEKLEGFRQDSELYLGASFATISGAAEHGAIVHYRADEKSNRKIDSGEVLLLDSGGQYLSGTTDITRTMVRNIDDNSLELASFKSHFTAVLKGHIALAMAKFPKGTAGSQLDALARSPLWDMGLDFEHGTGHGVGSYLCVHEGPQRISKRGGDAALQAGMVISNEPGYYEQGEYGIRIESLVLVQNIEGYAGFNQFETITLAPIDTRLIEIEKLNEKEKDWLNNYHKQVFETLSPMLGGEVVDWLKLRTEAI